MRTQGGGKSHSSELVRGQDKGRGPTPVLGPMGDGLHGGAGVGGWHTPKEPRRGNMEGARNDGMARRNNPPQSFARDGLSRRGI